MLVVPTFTVMADGVLFRIPVSVMRKTVGTWVPVPSFDVTPKGSGLQTAGLVALHTEARPPGPLVVVKMSGCCGTIVTAPRKAVPLLLMTIGNTPPPRPIGTTKVTCEELTE